MIINILNNKQEKSGILARSVFYKVTITLNGNRIWLHEEGNGEGIEGARIGRCIFDLSTMKRC